MLDERLSLAAELYPVCELAADIGTDHARLPAALLRSGRCGRMILTDLSPDALANARREICRQRLTDRAEFRLGNGLAPLREPCQAISITGMGGRTIRGILLDGRDQLRGAVLILSAHTDLPLVRAALREIGYAPDREEPCFCAGRYYLVIRALPGRTPQTDREIRLGSALYTSASPVLLPYLRRRREILAARLRGLLSAAVPDEALIREVREDLSFYDLKIGGITDDRT